MHVYVETEEELDALLALLEEFAAEADFAADEVFSTPGALALADKLRAVDVDTLTPIEAMNLIYQWKKEL